MLVRPRRAKLGNQSAPARTQFGRGEPNRWLTKRLAAAGGAVPAVSAPLLFVPRCGGGGAEREEPLRVCVCVCAKFRARRTILCARRRRRRGRSSRG